MTFGYAVVWVQGGEKRREDGIQADAIPDEMDLVEVHQVQRLVPVWEPVS